MLPAHESEKQFFQELDKYSTTLRHTAEKFADFLMKIKNQTAEIKALTQSLDRITASPIAQMDESIIELDKSLLLLNAKLQYPNTTTFMKQAELAELIKQGQKIALDMADLSEKAIELNGQH